MPLYSEEPLHSDPRLAWIGDQILGCMSSIGKDSVLDLLTNGVCTATGEPVPFEYAAAELFEHGSSSLCIFAVSGDQFENPDRRERRQRPYIQRLRFSQNGTPEDSTATRSVHCVFFAKTGGAAIAAVDAEGWDDKKLQIQNADPESTSAGHNILDQNIETMTCEAPSLVALQAMLTRVYLPLFEEIRATTPHPTLHSEIVGWAKRLSQQTSGLIGQVSAERTLPMPATPIVIGDTDADIKAAAGNEEIVREVDAAVTMWHAEISATLRQSPQKEGPLGEIEFWKEKYSALSGLYEQVGSDKVKIILAVAKAADCNAWHAISGVLSQLTRQHNDAKDNVRFLGTLDRQFRAISNVTPDSPAGLQPIIDAMASMMISLKVVWTLSRCYSTEEKMGGLLEKIAILIAKKVVQHIDHRSILSQPFDQARKKIAEGQQVLYKWRSAYHNVASETAQNPEAGDVPWSFNQDMLFDRTDYIAERCNEYLQIISILEYYHTVLGSQLKAVLKDTSEIEGILRDLQTIKKPLETLNFDPFEPGSVHHWHLVFTNFNTSVAALDQQVTQFIHNIFDAELRSAESAFELLQSFKSLNTRSGEHTLDIKKLLQTKSDRILQQFLLEIKRVETIFVTHKDNPPLTKNQPPIAGAIHWSSSLFQRLRKPVLRFQDEGMLAKDGTEVSQAVRRAYVELAKQLKNYATSKYKDWKDEVATTVSECLRWKILKKVGDSEDLYTVNFNRNLFETIKEATYLDRLGFDVPPDALNVTLQDEAYHNYVESLQQMLATFNQELALVASSERDIMLGRIRKLQDVLKPGVEDLNWLSLGIAEFIQKCNGEITEFRNFARDIRKYVGILNTNVVQRIAATQLVPDLSHFTSGPQILELQQVADELESYRTEKLEFCVRAYQSAPQSLKSIELLVEPNSGASTLGKSPLLASTGYYRHWERKIHRAILKMVVNSLTRFTSLLGYQKDSRRRKSPLFRVQLQLIGSNVDQYPKGNEIRNTISKIVASIIMSSKSFCRWLNNQCIESSKGKFDDKLLPANVPFDSIFTYASDISEMPPVYKIQGFIQKQYLQSYAALLASRMSEIGGLYREWVSENKEISVEEQGKLNLVWYEYYYKFNQFMMHLDAFDYEQKYEQVGFMLIDKSQLWTKYVVHLKEWLQLEGQQLNDRVKDDANKLDNQINVFAEELRKYDGDDLSFEGLQALLQIMDDACQQSLEIETKYRNIEFVYEALVKFRWKDSHTPDELEVAFNLSTNWQAVLREVKSRNVSLAPKKIKFRRQTQQEVIQFAAEVKNALGAFRRVGPGRNDITLEESVALKNEWRGKVDKMLAMRSNFAVAEKLLGLDISTYQSLQQINEELGLVEFVLRLYEDWMVYQRKWSKLLWMEVRIEDMTKITEDKVREAKKMARTHGTIMPFTNVQQHILNFQTSLPLLTKLKSPALKARHWKELMRQVGKQFNHEHITLEDLVALELHNFPDEIDAVVLTAAREAGVEKDIQTIKDFWASKEFVLVPYSPKGLPARVSVLSDTSDIQEAVDDNILKISGLTNVKWVEPFIDEVRLWGKKLAMVNEVISMWGGVQVQWQYLESIFTGSEDIANQLPKETLKFKDLDRRWVRIMNDTANTPNVEQCCNLPDRLLDIKYIKEKLDECQKDLANYLLHKRDLFPRFFFISDDELLSILATSSAVSVQEHMLKMFDNSALLLFKDDSEIIEGVQSQEGEVVMFDQVIDPTTMQIETWLQKVLEEGRRSLRGVLKAAVFYYPKMERLDWVNKYHGMVGLTGAKIWWTFQIEDAFAKIKKGRKTAVKDLLNKLSSQLDDLVVETAKDLPKLYRKKVNTLIIVDVHGRDIVDRFVRDSVLEAREFDWESQLRFYWDKPTDTCTINQCAGNINYGFEYLGLNGRLVITPLTDRCFLTLTTALAYKLGGSPGGPAGTGKTESVKDLAKACGLHCLVTNCGDGLDYRAMGTIFSGLSQAGSWGCFDEFNRIDLPVLSVVSEQLRRIQDALKRRATRFNFEGREIALIETVGVFITMNPGYAGRVELPDNLKALFRPVVMVVPDMELIAENMLFSEGFVTARELAKKMVTLYSLARGQLSKQYHYDWGLRALKAVLVMAGALKRGAPELAEKTVLMRALRDMNAPKFVAEDEPLFRGLLSDLFPGLDPTRVPQENLSKAAAKVLREAKLVIDSRQVDKVVQLYETMQTRHTTMVVGPTGGGKSVVINTLKGAQDELRLPTKLYVINAKAQPTTTLYGYLDPMTRNWTDGIFSNVFRNINRVTKDSNERERKYIVFDGDVDAKWVEDLNSVMDDNRLLTLANGERIRLHPTCSLLYEVGDLQYASPATVSRCGMVYLDPINLSWNPFVQSWLAERGKDESEQVKELIEKYVPTILAFILDNFDEGTPIKPIRLVVPTSDLNMCRQLCTLLQTTIPTKLGVPEPKVLECIFIFACVWSFGAFIGPASDRERFDSFLKRITGWQTQDNGEQLERFISAGTLPERRSLFDYVFDTDDQKWKPWLALRKPFEAPIDGKFNSILVSTEDTERLKWILDKIISNRTPFLAIGESGTAKTVTIQSFLRELKSREKMVQSDGSMQLDEILLEMNFSSRTSGLDAQRTLEDNVEKKTSTVLGPPTGKRLLVFVDDVNMPKVDLYGTQQPIAFLKLLLGQQGWYDRKDLSLKQVRDVQFLAAMAPPGGGRNALDPRFVSLFSVFNVPFPDSSSLRLIYYEILNNRLEQIGAAGLQGIGDKIIDMTLALYNSIVESMPATPKNFHYVFNLRDLSRVYQGLYRITRDKFATEESVVRLWRNETTRVFSDRMSAGEDKQRVKDFTDKLIIDHFPVSADTVLQEPLLFGDFGDFEPDSDKKRLHLYEDFGADFSTVRQLLEAILEEINSPVMKMDLVMFDMAVEHLLRIIRVINVSRGHCLLVGVGGSGKQSLAKLAAAVSQMAVFEISLSRGYNEDSFREDLKKLYNRCGVDNQQVVFLFMDMHVKQEGFLELINNMLASGMVPALFTEDEKEPLYSCVQQEVASLGLNPSKDNLWAAFVNRCRDNLHIVLAMTPSGDVLRTRCRNFPSLINNTTIDWFTKWPAQALSAVAAKHLGQDDLPDYLRIPITEYFVFVHTVADEESVRFFANLKRRNFVTPKNFLAFLSNYSKLLTEKRVDIDEITFKLKTGLEKLQKASEDVAVLSTELAEKEVDLAEKTRKNNEMLAETTELKEQNEVKMKEAQETEEELSVRNVEIEKDSAEANKVLEEAMPALRDAQAALEHLDKAKVDELKAFTAPAEKVVYVAKMICVLLNADKASWDAARALMNQPSFIPSVKGYPLDTLTERKMREVGSYTAALGNMDVASMRSASLAAAELFRWVKALQEYWEVAKQVAPKKAKVEKLRTEKKAMEEKLTGIKNEIEFRNETVRSLTIRLEAGVEQARKLQEETAIMQRRLDAARRLINGFTSERKRWHEEMDNLKEARTRLVGDCLLGAAFMSYLGAFTYSYRNDTLYDNWVPELKRRNVPFTDNYSIKKLFTNEVQLSQWASNGLPMDDLSVMNGILTVESTRGSSHQAKDKKSQMASAANIKKQGRIRFPLCIDPQKQAVNWIKRTHADNSRFEVATFSDPDFLKRLEFCIQYGIPFLFENVDEFIDPIIDAVLDPQFRYESGQKMIKIGDKDIAWDDNFKLYLCTKLSNPHYTAEVFGKTLVINYSVTQDGLESQLLNEVVAIERVSLQTQSEELVQTMAENRAQLKQLEESLIRELTLATGNILDNDELIETLENTKSSASDVTAKLQQAEQMAEETERSRQEYRPVARRGAILFFVMAQLSAVNSMYEYSLSAFLNDVFKHSILKSENAFETKDRLHNIIEYLTYTVYKYVCMGIFEMHKLTFALQMTIRLMYDIDTLPPAEVEFFIRGCVLAAKDFPDNCTDGLLTDGQWNDICKLAATIDVFHKLTSEVRENLKEWATWSQLDRPEAAEAELPQGYSERLSPFQKLCLLRCFRPDRVYIAVGHFISKCELMGEKFTIPPILKYTEVFKQSSCISPIVCVVSPGANPTEEIQKLAEKVFGDQPKFHSVSLGQGQGEHAMHLFEQGATRGWWVLLANAHLMISFMKDLEKAIEKREGDLTPHSEFRLWITSEPSNDFPLGILQRSLKVVNEPPNGLKMNMKNTMSRVTEADMEECSHPAFRPLVYTLAFFHAVVQERRKYGKMGWNVTYDFNETDFAISMKLAKTYLDKAVAANDPIPWDTLRYLTGEAMYGGRVSDNFDRRIVKCYLEEYFGDFLFDTFQVFHFFEDDKADYCLPPRSTDLDPENPITRDDMAAHIEAMPLENTPDVFGLHPNAETGYLRSAADMMWATLKELMPRATGEAGHAGGREDALTVLSKEILTQIPSPFDRKAVLKQQLERCRLMKQDGLQPTQVVLMQEIERWNNLVTVMVATLNLLQKALAGIIGMSAELDDLAVCLSNGTLPAQWRKLAPSTRKSLGRWLVHFQRRYEQFKRWIELGEPPCMWLSGLMIPESYISALVQITCRKYVWPLDKSTIFTRVSKFESADEITEPPKDGAYVCGLFLEGAKYDMQRNILDTQEKKVLIRELPVLEIIPQESSKVKLVATFRTPVYVTRDRRNAAGVGLVFEADLTSDQHYSHWVLESVALILNSDD